ncbi:hypothetical protein evm_014915, partial [Chilo suppressalis]
MEFLCRGKALGVPISQACFKSLVKEHFLSLGSALVPNSLLSVLGDIVAMKFMRHYKVKHQVAYLGLVENVRVRRAGFACRVRYDRFLKRYKMLSQYTWPNFRAGTDRDAALVLARDLRLQDIHYGHTKLFIRSAKTLHSLEAARAELIPSIVILLQKLWRGTIARMRYRKMKAALTIYNAW